MKQISRHLAGCILLLTSPLWAAAAMAAGDDADLARQILQGTGVQGGMVVEVGCGNGQLTAALHVNDGYVVQGLDADPQNVEAARRHIRSLGLYGKVSAEPWDGQRLPYIDNFANLIVLEKPDAVPMREVMRVLAPNGVAYVRTPSPDAGPLTPDPSPARGEGRQEARVAAQSRRPSPPAPLPQAGEGRQEVTSTRGWTKIVKPWPNEIDEWTHYLHDATNNAVAQDKLVGPPEHYQWIGTPNYLRHHDSLSGLSALVSAKGRLYYVVDLGPRWSVEMPPQWTLVARDAFSGVILWQKPIAKWHPHLWPLKRGPAQLMRRLVAVGDTVYVTLGVGEPVTSLDGATGRLLRTYAGTEGAEEIILSDGVLYIVVNDDLDAYKSIPTDTVDVLRAAGRDWNWDRRPRRLLAIEAASGKTLWSRQSSVATSTLAAAGQRLYFDDGNKIVCLEAASGKDVWASKPLPQWNPMHVLYSPTLIVYGDVVLFSGGEKMDPIRGGNDTMTALSARTGEVLWTAPHPGSGYASAEDLFVIGGQVWCGATTGPRDSGIFTARDLFTGQPLREFPPDDWRHMPHHRCYRGKATCNYILTSRTGIEFVDLESQHWTSDHWVRGSCNYGIMPANGLIYAPPHSCACYLLAKLSGFNALAPRSASREVPREAPDAERLERGPAYGAISGQRSAGSSQQSAVSDQRSAEDPHPNPLPKGEGMEWPTYRHDAARSGVAGTSVTGPLTQLWQAELGGKITGCVVADGKVFVASVDAHTITALDSNSGKTAWTFTAESRVDSPPTIWQGLVLFGSADGHVYCLRSADGALVWRFRAAPLDQRLMSFEQVESVWPVSGSVLVRDGVVYSVAGRAMWLDGGLRFLRLDARTGRKLSESVLDDKYPGTQDNLQKDVKWPNLPVALPDVLSCDGRYVYMRSQPFDLDGNRTEVITPRHYEEQRGETAHLFSPTGFLDDSYWHRTYWIYGRSFISAAGGWQLATYRAPTAKIMVADPSNVYGFGIAPLRNLGTPNTYHLFACPKEPEIINPRPNQVPRKQGTTVFGSVIETHPGYQWSQSVPMMVRGMVLADQTLFIAGPPVLVDETEYYQRYADPALQAKAAEHVASFEGKRGALVMAVSKAEGKSTAAYRLDSPPVFDGLCAAGGRLFLSTMDGKVLCLGPGGSKALEPAPNVELGPAPDTAARSLRKPARTIQETKSHPDFQKLSAVQIEPSDLGYRVTTAPGSSGLALRQLATPIAHRASLRLKVRTTPGATSPDTPGNAFLVFGNSPDADKLIECGYRISGKSISILDRSLPKGKGASKKANVKANQVAELEVAVDLDRQKVTLTVNGQTVEAALGRRLASITWVGCAVQSVKADFGRVEVRGE